MAICRVSRRKLIIFDFRHRMAPKCCCASPVPGIEVMSKPTLEACRLLEELKKGQAHAILHCTCRPGFGRLNRGSPRVEIARVLVCLDHVASFIVNAGDGLVWAGRKTRLPSRYSKREVAEAMVGETIEHGKFRGGTGPLPLRFALHSRSSQAEPRA